MQHISTMRFTTIKGVQSTDSNRWAASVVMCCRDTLRHYSWRVPCGGMYSIALTSLFGRDAHLNKYETLSSAMAPGSQEIGWNTSSLKTLIDRIWLSGHTQPRSLPSGSSPMYWLPQGGHSSPCNEKGFYDSIPTYFIMGQKSAVCSTIDECYLTAQSISTPKKILDGQQTDVHCHNFLKLVRGSNSCFRIDENVLMCRDAPSDG